MCASSVGRTQALADIRWDEDADGSRQPRINRLWIEELMQAANGPNGLTIVPEPQEPVLLASGSVTPAATVATAAKSSFQD